MSPACAVFLAEVVGGFEATQPIVGQGHEVGGVWVARFEGVQAPGEEVGCIEHVVVDVVENELVQLRGCDASGRRHGGGWWVSLLLFKKGVGARTPAQVKGPK